jgi:cellulose synthase/poly-beta-1,6-N-acetylglucosamine synthase-like glycosyltransferase
MVRMPASSFRLVLVALVLAGVFGASGYALIAGSPGALLGVAVGYMVFELAMATLLTVAAALGIRASRSQASPTGPLPSVAVIIAAHNERDFILGTLASIRERGGQACEVIIASDGSTDGMNALLIERLKMVPDGPDAFRTQPSPPVRLLTLPKVGKGAAMNAALERVQAEVVVTLDADTTLGENALSELVAPFVDPEVEAAAGFIYVRNAQHNLLTRYQFTEYVKNFVWRIGLAHMGVSLQVSGAFGALRTRTLRALGGFDAASLVEDYEIIYRLHDVRRREGRRYAVVAVPQAAAFTEVPERWANFIQQRTRWFTGFLQTLFDYRALIGSRVHGAVGLFMLPIKCIDATLPFWGFASLLVLLGTTLAGREKWELVAVALFVGKWLIDALLYAGMVRWHARAFPERQPVPRALTQYTTSMTESLGFNWLRQVAVLRAYVWFFRRTHRWEQPRWQQPDAARPLDAASR